MGGTIAMIIRKPDGETLPMLRWTNILTDFLGSATFLRGDFDAWWPEFSKEWLAMRDDHERHRDTGRFELEMTPVYFPHDRLAPDGYGLVVVDFPARRVLDIQGYSALGMARIAGFDYMNDEEVRDMKEKHAEGRMPTLNLHVRTQGAKTSFLAEIDVSGRSWDEFRAALKTLCVHGFPGDAELGRLCADLGVDVPRGCHANDRCFPMLARFPYRSDWVFSTFEESAMGHVHLKRALEDLGYVFAPEDEVCWRSFVAEGMEDTDPSTVSRVLDLLETKTRARKKSRPRRP